MRRVIIVAVVVLVGLPLGTGWAQQSSPEPRPPAARSVPQVTSDSLVGTTVRDAQGKDIGQVSQLLIDAKDGKVTSVIIKRGGAFGFGGKDMSVPWEALKLQRDQDKLVVTMQQDMLEQAPRPQSEQGSPQREQGSPQREQGSPQREQGSPQREQGSQNGEQPSASPSTNSQGQPSPKP
jgi:sporulation protein YlmC with PRC-barrel domain